MKKFKFKLQPVLKHAKREEDRLKQELTQLQIRLKDEQDKLSQLEQKRGTARNDYLIKTKGRVDLEEVKTLKKHLEILDKKINSQHIEINLLEEAITTKIPEVIQGMQKRQILENLKERKKHEHITTANRMEINLMMAFTPGLYF